MKNKVNEIKMPVYRYEDIDGTEHYDFEEMAIELGDRIKKALNINVVVVIQEMEEV